MVYLLVDVVFGLCNIVVNFALGMDLELPSDDPYFSTSLRDFWGRRWNLMVTNLLRHTVYIPVRTGSNDVLGRRWASLPGVIASFLVSGLMHELLFYYVTRATPTWGVCGCRVWCHEVVRPQVETTLGRIWAHHGGVCGWHRCCVMAQTRDRSRSSRI